MAKRKPWVDLSHEAQPLPGDELETWSKTHLVDMDRRFCERLEHAIARGDERPVHNLSGTRERAHHAA